MKILSTSPQKFLSSLKPLERRVLDVFMKLSRNNPFVYISQETVGEWIGKELTRKKPYDRCHINKTVAQLKKMGALIVYKRRFNNSNITILNSKFFSSYEWYSELKHWFRVFPTYLFSLSLVLSAPPVFSKMTHYSEISYKKDVSPFPVLNPSCTKKGEWMSEVVENRAKIRSICLALNARGACITNSECLNLTAFSMDVLEKACAIMKKAQGVEYPGAFFFATCRTLTIDKGERPHWERPQTLRDENYVLLKPEEEKRNFNGKESGTQSPWHKNKNFHKGDRDRLMEPYKVRHELKVARELVEKARMADIPVVVDNTHIEFEHWLKELPEKKRLAESGDRAAAWFLDIIYIRIGKLKGISVEEAKAQY